MKTGAIIPGGRYQGAVVLDKLKQHQQQLEQSPEPADQADYFIWKDGLKTDLHPIFGSVTKLVFAKRDVISFVHQTINFGFDIPNQIHVPICTCSNWRMSDIAAAAICDHIDSINNQWVKNWIAWLSMQWKSSNIMDCH